MLREMHTKHNIAGQMIISLMQLQKISKQGEITKILRNGNTVGIKSELLMMIDDDDRL